MDDSERSYGYSEDIYHGKKKQGEESYEYGPEPEGLGADAGDGLSPEEAAMRIEDRGLAKERGEEEPVAGGGTYDYDRSGSAGNVESFTWDQSDSGTKEEEPAETTVQSRP